MKLRLKHHIRGLGHPLVKLVKVGHRQVSENILRPSADFLVNHLGVHDPLVRIAAHLRHLDNGARLSDLGHFLNSMSRIASSARYMSARRSTMALIAS